MQEIIEPKILKGFRDSLPAEETRRLGIIHILQKIFESFGFVPIDTPLLEYAEVLLGKGGGETDKQVYRFADHGGRDVALRFDLTVPFARFMARNRAELTLPFKRYHIAKVFRGENTQKGRYREFFQCDFDIVGTDAPSADLDILLLMGHSLAALGVPAHTIRINHRGIMNRLLEKLGLAGKGPEVLRIIDKLGKVGLDEVKGLLAETAGTAAVEPLLAFIALTGSNREILKGMTDLVGSETEEIARLSWLTDTLEKIGVAERYRIDPSITRGLDYYTGIVFETTLDALPGIGSVCSGGRYDNLAGLYTKEYLPGVGASIGLDRLMAGLEELKADTSVDKDPPVLILALDEALFPVYHAAALKMRAAGISCEVFPEKKKIPQQFKFAESKGIRYALIRGTDEDTRNLWNLKNLQTRESFDGIGLEDVLKRLAGESGRTAG
jgi:histidyl-tRNA synthetase